MGDDVDVFVVVGVRDRLAESVGRAVIVAVAEGDVDGETVPDDDNDAVALELALGVTGALDVTLALAPLERDAVGETVAFALRLIDPVPVFVGLHDEEGVPL